MAFHSGLEHIVREQELLTRYTWLRIGGPAQYFAEPTNLDELATLVRRCREQELAVRLLGGGSNLLVRDEGVPGLVIHLSAAPFCVVSVRDGVLSAGGGAKLSQLISTAVREGLAGIEQLAGIPGTVGGALHGNASCHGADIGQCTSTATLLTHNGEIVTRRREELVFSYRGSSLDEFAILEVQFALEPADALDVTKRMQKLWIVNRASQPLSNQNAGMIFKDHGGVSAASLMEQAGLRATRVGRAELSDRNANFVVVQPGAPAGDVQKLIEHVRERVAQRLGVDLETALEVW
jgi:UDP-N-acetylmuramate dehydrogenase